jgi:hypothetical protein
MATLGSGTVPTATFTIHDGGLGDDDLATNGTIVDQGGPGDPGPAPLAAIPTLDPALLFVLVTVLALAGVKIMRG